MSIDEMDAFGLDQEGLLYWDGHPVKVQRGITLTWWQGAVALLSAGAALAVAVVEVLTFLGFAAGAG